MKAALNLTAQQRNPVPFYTLSTQYRILWHADTKEESTGTGCDRLLKQASMIAAGFRVR
jgi:hypothetical protein